MIEEKYVGLDVHRSSTVAAVHNERGKRMMESILETERETIQSFLNGLTGTVHVTFEEGTHAVWVLPSSIVVMPPEGIAKLRLGLTD
jgi:hypothetical protein